MNAARDLGILDLALAASANVILTPENSVTFAKARMLAPDGRCKTFDSRADGFVRIARNTEIVEAESEVDVVLIGRELRIPDLVVIGSHCAGLDLIAGALSRQGFTVKVLAPV